MNKIKCYINQAAGLHCKFGEEKRAVYDFLDKRNDPNLKTVGIIVSSTTQLLAVDLYGFEHKVDVEFYDENGNQFKEKEDAHYYVNHEFIEINMFYDTSVEEGNVEDECLRRR